MRVSKVSNENRLLSYVKIDVQGGPELDGIVDELNHVVFTAESSHPYLTILRDKIVSALRERMSEQAMRESEDYQE